MTTPKIEIGHWCVLVNASLSRIYGRMRENGFPVEPAFVKPAEEYGMAAYMLMGDIPAEVAAVLLQNGDWRRMADAVAEKAAQP